MKIYDLVVQLVGSVPSGLSDAVYVFSLIILFFLICEFFAFLHTLFRSSFNL